MTVSTSEPHSLLGAACELAAVRRHRPLIVTHSQRNNLAARLARHGNGCHGDQLQWLGIRRPCQASSHRRRHLAGRTRRCGVPRREAGTSAGRPRRRTSASRNAIVPMPVAVSCAGSDRCDDETQSQTLAEYPEERRHEAERMSRQRAVEIIGPSRSSLRGHDRAPMLTTSWPRASLAAHRRSGPPARMPFSRYVATPVGRSCTPSTATLIASSDGTK